MTSEPPTQQLGEEGDVCAACGAALATDQRYCLNCGTARAEPRLNVQEFLRPGGTGGAQAATAGGAAPPGGIAPGPNQQWSMVTAVFAIGLLGVMLLLGVLIGKEGDDATVAAAPTTTTTSAVAPAPVATAPAEAPAEAAAAPDPNKNAAAAGAPGPVEKGGSGSTEGIAAADTEASAIDQAKSGEDVVATQGDKAPLDPSGKAGAGSDAVCIGC